MELKFEPKAAGSYTGDKISITSNGGNIDLHLSGAAKNPKPLLILTESLPSIKVNEAKSIAIEAEGGDASTYEWSVKERTFGSYGCTTGYPLTSMDTGLCLYKNGTISGKPKVSGSIKFTVVLESNIGSAEKELTVNINPITQFMTQTLTPTSVGRSYDESIQISGGTSPFKWSYEGTLPQGLSFTDGRIYGTTYSSGEHTFTIKVKDASLYEIEKAYTLYVAEKIKLETVSFSTALLGIPYEEQVICSEGLRPYTFAIIEGSLPDGLSLGETTGMISGTPQKKGRFDFRIQVTDSSGSTATGLYYIVVKDVVLKPSSGTLSYSKIYTHISQLNGTPPNTFEFAKALEFVVKSVPAGSSISMQIYFDTLPTNPVFYKIKADGQWEKITNYSLSGKILTISITDNGPYDQDATLGIIRDPITVGVETSGSSGTPSGGTTTSTDGGGGGAKGCFIATVAFGSYLHPHVQTLKDFRDEYLVRCHIGRKFVDLYYRFSPDAASYIEKHEGLKFLCRIALTPIVYSIRYPFSIFLIAFGVPIALIVRRIYKAGR